VEPQRYSNIAVNVYAPGNQKAVWFGDAKGVRWDGESVQLYQMELGVAKLLEGFPKASS
jgi:hypothetical protein